MSIGCRFFAVFIVFCISHNCIANEIPVESKERQQTKWAWLTNNRYRVVMQCQEFPGAGVHKPAWIELDLQTAFSAGEIPSLRLNPDSIRVVEYDINTKQPVRQADGSYFVPAKIDEWPRYHKTAKLQRMPHLSWIRRVDDNAKAVYICYFDLPGYGEQQRMAKPSYIGTGDTLSFGVTDKTGYVRGYPIVVDWNGDGKKDILTSMYTVPERCTYLFTNSGSSIRTGFEKAIVLSDSIGGNVTQALDVDDDGKLDIVKTGGYYSDFIANDFKKWVKIDCPLDSDIGKVISSARIVRWFIVDWDNDGIKDVVVGADSWKEHGLWTEVNGYDKDGNWSNGPLRGWFYVFKNTGSNQAFDLADPFQVTTINGDPADIYGFPSPMVVDIDNDGDLDIVSGDFLDKIWIFKNVGTRSNPHFAPPARLMTTEGEFQCEFQALQLFVADWEDDGDIDIFFQAENNRVAFIENTGRYDSGADPVFFPVKYLRCKEDYPASGQLVACDLYDWDKDGDIDLIFGDSGGFLGWYRMSSSYPNITFDEPILFTSKDGIPARIIAGPSGSIQGPSEAKWGYTVPNAGDWDMDGYADILMNNILGRIFWLKNPGANGAVALESMRPVEVAWQGAAPKPVWNWWNPGVNEWATQWRSTVQIIDYDKDGLPDAVALDSEGYLVLHRRVKDGNTLKLMPGQRLFQDSNGKPLQLNADTIGKSGRRKFEMTDWDKDGDWDLICDHREDAWNVTLYLNAGDNSSPKLVKHSPLADITFEGHSCSPAVIDIEGDGILDLLVGAEDGHFYCFHRSYIDSRSKLEANFYSEN